MVMYRYKKHSESGGSQLQKYRRLDGALLEFFGQKIQECAIIHDQDLRRWAISINRAIEFQIDDFSASCSWITRFKMTF